MAYQTFIKRISKVCVCGVCVCVCVWVRACVLVCVRESE